MIRAALLALALALFAAPAYAVQPDEILDDPVLEERARDLSRGLRCLVCRNESIDESNADLARDMRILLRERLVGWRHRRPRRWASSWTATANTCSSGPRPPGPTSMLWIAGPAMLLGGAPSPAVYLRRRATARPADEAGLSDSEKARLADLPARLTPRFPFPDPSPAHYAPRKRRKEDIRWTTKRSG
jgi:cytochrome c-type biogenesis protein CcmH